MKHIIIILYIFHVVMVPKILQEGGGSFDDLPASSKEF